MPGRRVLITDYAWPDLEIERQLLREADAELIVAESDEESALVAAAEGVDGILVTWAPVTPAVLASAPDCQIVGRLGIGLDNIDVAYCSAHGIPVCNVPDYCGVEVAEHTLALLLALARKVAWFHAETKAGVYDLQSGPPLRRLAGQTVGVVGLGGIGVEVASRCLALGFQVVGVQGRGTTVAGVRYLPWEELLEASDYLTLHVPLCEATRRMVDAAALQRMKPTAYLINTARGGLIDSAALAEALQEERLAGAALDVQDPEPPDLQRPPWNDPRVIVTPHAAFLSAESLAELRRQGAEQVRDVLLGRRPAHVVNPQVYDCAVGSRRAGGTS